MGIKWFRKKNKKEKELDEAFGRITKELNAMDDLEEHKKRQHYILESCEQIIETTREIEEQKAEYRVVTNYLDDIKKIEDLPPRQKSDLLDVARNVVMLDKAKKEFLHSEKKLSDNLFALMEQNEDEVPSAIKRMQANEMYQSAVKRDMSYLEGEKSQWIIKKDELKKEQKILKSLIILLFTCFASLLVLFFWLQTAYKTNLSWAWTSIFALTAVAGFCIYIKLQMDGKDSRQADANMNNAIVLLNKVKIKYVNVTNAIEYTKEKYHVSNSYELNYLWEKYIETLNENEKYTRNNEDYEYFTARLVRLLNNTGVHDSKIWISQAAAIIDPEEMSEVRHQLIERRKKIRQRIEFNTKVVSDERDEIDRLLGGQREYIPEIAEIIRSVDKITGRI